MSDGRPRKSLTAKDARHAKEGKSFTAKDARHAKEGKSFTAKAAEVAKERIIRKFVTLPWPTS